MSAAHRAEPDADIPTLAEVDVLVAGGGIAGCFAAVAAGRQGGRTMLVDRFGSLGGNMGPGLIQGGSLTFFDSIEGGPPRLVAEFWKRMSDVRGPTPAGNAREANAASYVASKMLEEAGVEPMLCMYCCDPLVKDGAVHGLFVESKSGRQLVMARVVIDATGEADVAARAGAPMLRPGDAVPAAVLEAVEHLKPMFPRWSGAEDARFLGTPSMGFGFEIAGVNWERFEAEDGGSELEADFNPFSRKRTVPAVGEVRFQAVRGPRLDGGILEMRLEVRGPVRPGDARHVAALEFHARSFVFEAVELMRGRTPGFEGAYLLQAAPYLGARGGTCIEGEYTVTAVDMAENRLHEDVIFVAALVDDDGRRIGPKCDVPYRAMLPRRPVDDVDPTGPRGLDGLVAAGRSASHRRLLRTRPNAMLFGIAGGTAGALAAETDSTPRTLDVKLLQRRLVEEGVYLGDAARLVQIGLA